MVGGVVLCCVVVLWCGGGMMCCDVCGGGVVWRFWFIVLLWHRSFVLSYALIYPLITYHIVSSPITHLWHR